MTNREVQVQVIQGCCENNQDLYRHNTMASPGDPKNSRQLVLANGEKYCLRGIVNDTEIERWAEFCASVFAYKANPPPASYFTRHYFNDPFARAPSLIRIAVHEDAIVASCRVFARRISLTGGQTVIAGGIGEVCTSADHRRRGM